MSDPAFYVIRDDGGEEHEACYYGGYSFNSTLNDTRAHFDRAENARKQIVRLQTDGYSDAANISIVPVYLTAGTAIKLKIPAQKSGYVIQFYEPASTNVPCMPGYKAVTSYWKGNKKKPIDTSFRYDTFRGVNQTITASVMTKDEADTRFAEIVIIKVMYRNHLVEREEEDKKHWHPQWRDQKYQPNTWEIERLDRLKISVVKV